MSEKPLRVLDREEPLAGTGSVVAAVGAAVIVVVAAVVFAVGLLRGAGPEGYGTALAVALLAGAFALRRLLSATYPLVDVAEPRDHPVAEGGPLIGPVVVGRRPLLSRILVAAGAVLGAALLVPVSALGPRRVGVEQSTSWAGGVRLTDTRGRELRPDDVPAGGLSTVWPASGAADDTDAVVLVRLNGVAVTAPTNLDWVVDGQLVAYSKVCTHLGCPVGLFQEGRGTLFCPCHQQSFDATRGARPTFGPASRPLAQLPLGIDDDGYLVALGDFRDPVGPPVG